MFSRFLIVGAVGVIALCSLSVLAIPHGQGLRNRQNRPDNHTLNQERADAVKEAFEFAWDGYYKYGNEYRGIKFPIPDCFMSNRTIRLLPRHKSLSVYS